MTSRRGLRHHFHALKRVPSVQSSSKRYKAFPRATILISPGVFVKACVQERDAFLIKSVRGSRGPENATAKNATNEEGAASE
jgi:hypothetical protein